MAEQSGVKKPFYKRVWFIVLVIFVVLAIIGGACGTKEDKDTPPASDTSVSEPAKTEESKPVEKTEESKPEKPKEEWLSAGMYKVGTDIPAGEYFIKSSGMTYIQVSSDSSGSLESIVTNDNISTFAFVTVQDGQYLEFSSAKAILSEKVEPITDRGEGMYRVGIDIPAGEYKVQSTDSTGYIEVCSSSRGTLDDIVTNDILDGEKYITVSDGQYLKISGAKILES